MALEFRYFDDAEHPETLARTADGWTGERWGKVNTRNVFRAMSGAAGFPLINEAWDPEAPNLKLRTIRGAPWGGLDNGAGEGGWSVFQLAYLTPGLGGSLPPPAVGEKWTEVVPSTGNVTVKHDRRAPSLSNPFLNVPIGAGDGAPRMVGTTQCLVHVFYPDANAIDWQRLLQLHTRNAVNSDAILLPPVYATGGQFALLPGQARYETYQVNSRAGEGAPGGGGAVNNIIEVVHVLAVAEDHLYRYAEEDEKGYAKTNSAGQALVAEVELYEPLAFGGLW